MTTNSAPTPPAGPPSLVDLRHYDQSWYDAGRPKWLILVWWFVQAITFPLTLHAHHAPRRFLLRLFGAHIGKGVMIRPSARVHYPWKVAIGDYSWIGSDVTLYSLDEIAIGNNCVISQKSYLCTGSHDARDPAFGLKTAPIVIENGVWVATDCYVGPEMRIGDNALVGARSKVISDLPAQHICLGSPCKPQKPREIG
ncbi:MAG: hormogonium polysaccharide biosynthesis acetyltransferase HpsU [Leptolyngbyaceae cyanobacterium]